MLAYLNGEPGAERVEELLRDPGEVCFAHAVNLCEVYYDMIRRSSGETADQAMNDLAAAGVTERNDMDAGFWRAAAALKARGRVSLADCFCIALSQRLDADLVTSDHHEFDPLAASGVCRIRFIR